MDYLSFAQACFQKIVDESPANCCQVQSCEHGRVVDAGCACSGGWMAARYALEGLVGGRGQVGFARCVVDGVEHPSVELFLDDPVAVRNCFAGDGCGVFGVRAGEEYALGVSMQGAGPARAASGNLIAAEANSLFAGILEAGSLIPRAVDALQAHGITDIQWAWSSCPLAPMMDSAPGLAERRRAMMARHGVVSVWVRGEAEAIRAAVSGFEGRLQVHELKTACTYVRPDTLAE